MNLPGSNPSSIPGSDVATNKESMIPGSSGDFYGAPLKLCLVAYLRPEKKFESLDALVVQINEDITVARELYQIGENQDRLKVLPPAGTYSKLANAKKIALQFFTTPLPDPAIQPYWARKSTMHM
jgi:hypothetical protein